MVLSLYGLLHLPSVQTWLVKQATNKLSKSLHTKVSIKHVDFSFFNKLAFEELYIEDQFKDTLLYAGAAKVSLNDWFFVKDHITLHYIGLNNATIHLNRKDTTWNYQFLLDYFNTPSSNKTSSNNISFDFKEVNLNNIKFSSTDQWIGENMIFSIEKMNALIDKTDLQKQFIAIDKIKLDAPSFFRSEYEGNKPANYSSTKNKKNETEKDTSNNWTLSLNKISITNGSFQDEIETSRLPFNDHFDGQHFLFSAINGEIKNVSIKNNKVLATISLATKERSGLEIKKIEAAMLFTPEVMEFKNLDLRTNNSHLTNYYSMRYKSFNHDMNNFMSNVLLEGHFKNSIISTDDIAIFAPEVKSWNKTFELTGNAKGTIENLVANDLNIETGATAITGNVHLKGLSNINTTFIDFTTVQSHTNYNDLIDIIPTIKSINQPNLKRLGNIYFKGKFTGFINDFLANGTIQSNLGSINTNVYFKFPENHAPLYTGTIATTNFQLGKFINNNQVGKVAINGKVEGKGFTLDDLKANFTGDIQQFEFKGYNYQNIYAKGDFQNNKFKGQASINDPNIKIKKLEGVLSLLKNDISFNLTADLQHANLKNINLSKEELSLNGLFSLNFTGNNIDNFLGEARVFNATLYNGNHQLSFDSLRLSSTLIGNKKYLSLQTNEAEASVAGKFKILELPDAFKVFLNRYYPAYIKAPSYQLSNQDFYFNIQTKDIEEYVKLIDNRLSGFNNTSISGNLDLTTSELNIQGDIPNFGYNEKVFNNTILNAMGNRDTLMTNIKVGEIHLSDSLLFPDTKLSIISHNNISDIHLKTSATSTFNDADLNASIETLTDGVKIHFFPSSFIVNDKKWLLEKDGELSIRENLIDANQINFSNNNQQISIYTEHDIISKESQIVAKIHEVNIGDFFPFILKDPNVKGVLTGTAVIKDPLHNLSVEFKGKADSLQLENKLVGNVNIAGNANTLTGKIDYSVNTTDTTNIFSIIGKYNYKDSSDAQLNTDLIAEKIHLSILEPYLGDIFNNIDGVASSNLKLSGNPHHQYLTGEVFIKESAFKVAYTQCRYFIQNKTITFGKDEIDFGLIKLRDSLNNTATLSGKIHHTLFRDFSFENVKLETAKLALLNTTKNDNSAFYGNVIGRANMSLNGPISNLQMNINGEPSILDSSHIYLPTSEGKESNKIDYIEFIQFGSQMEASKLNENTNLVVTLNIKANPSCKVDVILDEETGDIIKGQGTGLINIKVGNIEPLSIRGNYNITKGEYNFNFQTFLQKPFTLNRGSITWNGDPYQANIDIDAEYLAKNVDISTLSSSVGFKQKEDVKIISHLTGVLQSPLVKFDFELPEKSDAKRDDIIVKRLADFKNDDNEMNKQVASLLLFNTFIIGNQNFLSQGNASSLLTNTIGGVVSNLLTNFFNKELEKATKGILTTYIDINPTLDIQKSASQLQANVRAGLKILFSNRLVLLVGGNLDYNNPTYSQQLEKKGLLTPDINIEWLINKDGSLRVVGFNRSSIDFTLNQRNRSGVQLSFRKDVNKISDIFKSRKRLNTENTKNNSPAIKETEAQ